MSVSLDFIASNSYDSTIPITGGEMTRKTAMLFTALVLGLGWAIRGHFGHEHGAAWAGAMAGLAIIVAAKRQDWSLRLPTLAALAGIGWGVGGMMSYGIVVGYGRGIDFGNVYYGLAMLGVIGGLYGFIGGGLFGLGLETTNERKTAWATLVTEMTVGGMLAWYVLIAQFEWKMTPPRSELWAGCLGAAVALAWFLQRNGYYRSLRVAAYSALGGGFGFAFGNFLQTMGTVSGLSFNWWNVMEFTLGFCGGLGMAYGVFTREWPESGGPSKAANWLALAFLFFALPLTNVIQSFDKERFAKAGEQLGVADPAAFAGQQYLYAYIAIALFLAAAIYTQKKLKESASPGYAPTMLISYTLFYMMFSHITKMSFYSGLRFQLEQLLYWVVFAAIMGIWLKSRNASTEKLFEQGPPETWLRWGKILGVVLVIIAVCVLISINSHDGSMGYHERFPVTK